MKTVCPRRYRHNGFVTTHALGHIMYAYTLLVPMNQSVLNKLTKEGNIRVSWITYDHSYYAPCLAC